MIDENRLIESLEKWRDEAHPLESDIITDVIGLVEDQPKVGEWIPCSERLPEAKGFYMDTLHAFAMGEANRHRELKVFDWDRTGGAIYANGEPVIDSYTFLASTWATPVIDLDGEIIPCYKMQQEVPDWSSDTKWPQSSLNILKGV